MLLLMKYMGKRDRKKKAPERSGALCFAPAGYMGN
jgi:hypothetical protein